MRKIKLPKKKKESKPPNHPTPKLQSDFGYSNHWSYLTAINGLNTRYFPSSNTSWLDNFHKTDFPSVKAIH